MTHELQRKEKMIEKGDKGYNSESDYFKFIDRAQVTTSKSKNDSYFAKMKRNFKGFKKGQSVFVKGPYLKEDVYNILRLFVDMKKILGLPYINVDKLTLNMDDTTSFMGEKKVHVLKKKYIRYNLDTFYKYKFFVYDNLCLKSLRVYTRQRNQKSLLIV
jgi:hypothetical protein